MHICLSTRHSRLAGEGTAQVTQAIKDDDLLQELLSCGAGALSPHPISFTGAGILLLKPTFVFAFSKFLVSFLSSPLRRLFSPRILSNLLSPLDDSLDNLPDWSADMDFFGNNALTEAHRRCFPSRSALVHFTALA